MTDILKLAAELFTGEETAIERHDKFNQLAYEIAKISQLVAKEDYINDISNLYNVSVTVFKKLVYDAEIILNQNKQQEKKVITYTSADDYFTRFTIDGVLWKAECLLHGIESPMERDLRFNEIAGTLSKIPFIAAREDYAVKIARKFNLQPAVLKKMVENAIETAKRKAETTKIIKRNEAIKLEGDPRTWPFFDEIVDKKGTLKMIRIDRRKFISLLCSFGFSRYSVEKDNYTFVRVNQSIIQTITEDEIIDTFEDYVLKDYDFAGAGCDHVDAEKLINRFYDNINSFFSKKMFARMKLQNPIVVNRDTIDTTFLYYQNGFVEINKNGYSLKSYEEMNGSVWDHQVKQREFKPAQKQYADLAIYQLGMFADFCWRIAGETEDRFNALCCIIGYMCHDFYDYKLKAVLFTDGNTADVAMGRTGKSLVFDMLQYVRSVKILDGKEYESGDKHKYEDIEIGTQIVVIDDIKHRGKNAFDFEDLFHSILNGLKVNAKYIKPFLQLSKIGLTTNKSLNIAGDSQKDRIIEFEVSQFFSAKYSPHQHYGKWFGREWDETDWTLFDHFICACCVMFHNYGLIEPRTINLDERKLRDHTCLEFVEFITEKVQAKFERNEELIFDKKILYEDFKKEHTDFNNPRFTQHRFTKWLQLFGTYRFGGRFHEFKSNGLYLIKYIKEKDNTQPTT